MSMQSITHVHEPVQIKEGMLEAYLFVQDENGQTIVKKRANSLLKNFILGLYAQMRGTFAETNARSITNVLYTPSPHSAQFNSFSAGADTTRGIVVGTSTAAVNINDFNLISPIPHGTGSGQLLYGSTQVTSLEGFLGGLRFLISRVLSNNSPGIITVNEVGLISIITRSGVSPYTALVDRTLITFTIPVGQSRNVIYEVRQT